MELLTQYVSKPTIGTRIDWSDPITEGLLACWSFSERGGGRITDSATINHGTARVNLKFRMGGVDCSNSWIDVPRTNLSFKNTDKISLFCVVRNLTNTANQGMGLIMRQEEAGNFQGWAWDIFTSGFLRFQLINNSSSNLIDARSSLAVSFNRRQYSLATTYNGSSRAEGVKHFINGRKGTTNIVTNTLTGSPYFNISPRIGAYNGAAVTSFLKGVLLIMAVWKRELTEAEIVDLHNNPYTMFESYKISIPTFKAPTTASTVFRKTLSSIGSRVGSRQVHGWS